MTNRRLKTVSTMYKWESNRLNNFAISSVGIGTAMQKSASALHVAGNDINESIGLIVAANSVVQNPEQVGTALKTMSMRLRGAKAELEEAGEATDGMCDSTSELQAKLKSLTGVDIMLDSDTFKDTFQIIGEMSKVWDGLTDVNKAAALELMGGKRQGNILESMIQNFEDAKNASTTAMNSAGSAINENEKYLDSINGKIQVFKASFESLSTNALGSGIVKTFIDIGTWIVKGADSLAKWDALLPAIVTSFITMKKHMGLFSVNSAGTGIKMGLTNFIPGNVNEISSYINDFNGLKNNKAQKEFLSNLKDSHTELAKYLGTVKRGQGTLKGYGSYLVSTTGKTIALNVATAALNAVLNAGIGILIGLAFTAISKIIDGVTTTTEEWKEKLAESRQELSDLKSEAETLNSELETTQNRIDELLHKDSLNLAEEQELKTLQRINAELRTKIALNKEEQKNKDKQLVDTLNSTIKKQKDNINVNGFTLGYHWDADRKFSKHDVIDTDQDIADRKLLIYQEYLDAKNRLNVASSKEEATTVITEYAKAIGANANNLRAISAMANAGNHSQALEAAYSSTWLKSSEETLADLDSYISSLEETIGDYKYTEGAIAGSAEDMANQNLLHVQEMRDQYNLLVGDANTVSAVVANIPTRPQFAEAYNALVELSDGGNLTAESIANLVANNQNLAQLLAYLSKLGLIDLSGVVEDKNKDGVFSAKEIKNTKDFKGSLNGLPEMFNETEEAVKDTDDAVSDLSDTFDKLEKVSEALENLDKAYYELNKDGKISFSTLNDIQEKFANVDGIENYINALAKANGNTNKTNKILGELAVKHIESKFTADELATANQNVVASMLREQGVANADTVAMQLIAKAKLEAAIQSGELANMTDAEAQAFANEIGSSQVAAVALKAYAYEKALANKNSLNTADSVKNLLTLAKAAGLTGQRIADLTELQMLQKLIKSGNSSINGLERNLARVKELKSKIKANDYTDNIEYNFTPVKFTGITQDKDKDKNSSSYTATEDPWLKRQQKIVDNAKHRVEMGKTLENLADKEIKINKSLKKKKKEAQKLQEQIDKLGNSKKDKKKKKKLNKELDSVNAEIKTLEKQQKNNTSYYSTLLKTYNKLPKKINNKQDEIDEMQAKWDKMSKKERKSKKGQKLKKDLKQAKKDLKALKEQRQDWGEELHDLELDAKKEKYEAYEEQQVEDFVNGKIDKKTLENNLNNKIKELFKGFDKTTLNELSNNVGDTISDAVDDKIDANKDKYEKYEEEQIQSFLDGKIDKSQLEKNLKAKIQELFKGLDDETLNELLGSVGDVVDDAVDDKVSENKDKYEKYEEEQIEKYLNGDIDVSTFKNNLKNKLKELFKGLDDEVLDEMLEDADVSIYDTMNEKFQEELDDLDTKRDFDLISEEDYYKEKLALAKEYYDENGEFADQYVDTMKEAYEYAKSEYIKSLQDQRDAASDFFSEQKQLLQDNSDKESYQRDQAEKRKTVSELKAQIAELERDTSEKSKKRVAELKNQLADAEDELSQFEKEYALDQTIAKLEEVESEYLKSIDDNIASIEENTEGIYSAVRDFAAGLGITLPADPTGYAQGTKSSIGGFVTTQEKGAEVVGVNKSNGFTLLTPNSMVWSNEQTQKLWELSKNPSNVLKQYLDNSGTNNIPQINSINAPTEYKVIVERGAVVFSGVTDNKNVIKNAGKELAYEVLTQLKKYK